MFTEDSDLLAFGVQKVFFKMDSEGNGKNTDVYSLGMEINLKHL